MRKTKLKDIGEFSLISSLQKLIEDSAPNNLDPQFHLISGIGDDAAIWESPQSTQLLTTDTVVEGVHFNSINSQWDDIGWKAMTANLSDIAAMGGIPLYCVISLGLNPDSFTSDILSLYTGILEASNEYSCRVVGGDISQSAPEFINIALFGYCSQKPLTRSNAQIGESIAVTGNVGGSLAGLKLLTNSQDKALSSLTNLERQAVLRAHIRPHSARIHEGRQLASAGVRAAIDISDGLYADLSRLCDASKVSAKVHQPLLPIDKSLKSLSNQEQSLLALQSGEEYELIYTAPSSLVRQLNNSLLTSSTIIGEITHQVEKSVIILDENNIQRGLPVNGWDHFIKQ